MTEDIWFCVRCGATFSEDSILQADDAEIRNLIACSICDCVGYQLLVSQTEKKQKELATQWAADDNAMVE